VNAIYAPNIIAACRCPAFAACCYAMGAEMKPLSGYPGQFSFLMTWRDRNV